MTYHRQFFIRNKFMGTVVCPPVLRAGKLMNQSSYCCFCPTCGDIWARFPAVSDKGDAAQWHVWNRHCDKHSYYSTEIPGSIHVPWEPEFSSTLPDDVIRYEFNQALKLFERLENDNSN